MPNSEAHHVLLKSQRNQIFTTLQDRGFVPTGFELQDFPIDNRKAVRLVQKKTKYSLVIVFRPGHAIPFLTLISPGEELSHETQECYDWSHVIENLEYWLSNILRETEAPDLWSGLEGGSQLLQDATNQPSDNLPFAQAELPEVRRALEEIKTHVIKTYELTETQRKVVDERFDHMEEAARRMGRKDWLGIVISNLLGVAYSLALNGDSTRDLFGLAALVIRKALGTMLYFAAPH
jgi:hypothetical protein